jgi:signal transduction histidine kinase
MAGLLAKERRDVRFSITDADQTIYDEHTAEDPSLDASPMYDATQTISLYGREWSLDIRTNQAFRAANTFAQPNLVLIAGLIIEGLIIALMVMLSRANTSAVAYADRVTAALRQEKQKLAMTNEELEQFAYVASHDLKTPIRGIGGLTEMLREDLEDYLNSGDALPEVGQNLDRKTWLAMRSNIMTASIH